MVQSRNDDDDNDDDDVVPPKPGTNHVVCMFGNENDVYFVLTLDV